MKPIIAFFATFLFLQLAHTEVLKWRQIKPWKSGQTGPSDREHPTIWLDAKADRLYLFGGLNYAVPQESVNDFWVLDLKKETWKKGQQEGIIPGSLGRAAVIPESSSLLYYGGERDGKIDFKIFLGTFVQDKISWSIKPSSSAEFPGFPNSLGSFIFNPTEKNFVSLCGVSEAAHCTALTVDLAQANSNSELVSVWGLLHPGAEEPAGRYGFSFALDIKRNRIVIASGQTNPSDVGGKQVFDQAEDTWFADLTAAHDSKIQWSKMKSPNNLPKRRNGCWAHDTENNQLYVWGGTADGSTAVPGLYRLDLNDETHGWQSMQTQGSAPIRASCVGLYDSVRKRVLFGFGNTLDPEKNKIQPFTDLWELTIRK